MPSRNTFSIKPIRAFVKKYLRHSEISIDPFARDCSWATYKNDLNPETQAQYHMDALEFLVMLRKKGVQADLIIFDPPYSLRQAKECYEGLGFKFQHKDTVRIGHWTKEKQVLNELLAPGGIILWFGWNSIGMGQQKRGYEIAEILLVAHGAAANDTICMAERKLQAGLFDTSMLSVRGVIGRSSNANSNAVPVRSV